MTEPLTDDVEANGLTWLHRPSLCERIPTCTRTTTNNSRASVSASNLTTAYRFESSRR